MTALAIIADDLSGALDSAAPFAELGRRTIVALAPEALGGALRSGAEIIAVSTDSREVAPEAARARVATALAQLPANTKLFKKIDSRLKGNLVAELDAIAFRKALVVPAIPAFGRWMRDGLLGGFGVDTPIDIADRLGPHAARATIPDATTQEDIRAALKNSDHDLLVGARALAEAEAERMGAGTRSGERTMRGDPTVFVIGSTDPITLEQVARLRRERPGTTHIAAPNGAVPEAARLEGPVTIVQAAPGEVRADPAEVARRLAQGLERLAPPRDATLVLSGGATAQAVLSQLGIDLIEVLGEVLPGLPLADAGGLKLITKSGGFGAPDTLVRVLERQGVRQ